MFKIIGNGDSILFHPKDITCFLYRKSNVTHDVTRLRCRRALCSAKLRVLDLGAINVDNSYGVVLSELEGIFDEHNHPGEDNMALSLQFKAVCRKRAGEESTSYRDIYEEVCIRCVSMCVG